jgi:hypothetical protein
LNKSLFIVLLNIGSNLMIYFAKSSASNKQN